MREGLWKMRSGEGRRGPVSDQNGLVNILAATRHSRKDGL